MDLLDLFVKIGVDDQASSQVSKIGSAIGSGLKTACKVGVAAVGAAATAIGTLGTQAIKSYADWEQLFGGVNTLFQSTTLGYDDFIAQQKELGKSAKEAGDEWNKTFEGAWLVEENANKAFMSAGLSMNQYMETVTSFSASLIQSLGGDTVAAAEMADMAIIDMADNTNKMGSSMESIQNAYQGFAKQNYTMLDNLKLGYGGTKEEMQRLLADAEAISGIEYDISSYSDVVAAIHVIQEEMGIAGATAEEASGTISGSINMLKASWENVLTAMAAEGTGDFVLNDYIDALVVSAKAVISNVLPMIETAINGVSSLITQLAPVIGTEVPAIIGDVLPTLLDAAILLIESLLDGILTALPSLLEKLLPMAVRLVEPLLGMLPQVLTVAVQLVEMLALGIAQAAPTLIPAAIDTVLQLCNALLSPESIQLLLDAAVALLLGLMQGITTALPMLVEQAPVIISELVNALIANLPMLLDVGIQLIMSWYTGIWSAFPTLLAGVWDICVGIVDTIGKMDWEEIGWTLLETIGNGILNFAASLLESVNKAFAPAIEWISVNLLGKAPGWGKDMIQGLIDGIRSMIGKVKSVVKDVAKAISDFLHFSRPETGPLREYETWMPDMIDGLVKGIEDNKYKLSNAVSGLASDMSANMTVTARGNGTAAVSGGNNTFNFNIYGAEGQDVRELADIVMERMQAAVSRKDAVFN